MFKPVVLDTGLSARVRSTDEIWHVPAVQIQFAPEPLPEGDFDALVLSSPQTLPLLREHYPQLLQCSHWGAVGERTAQTLDVEHNLRWMGGGSASGLMEVIAAEGFRGRILHPCSAETRLQPSAWAESGLEVVNWSLYKPVPHPDFVGILCSDPDRLARVRRICYFSGSAVRAVCHWQESLPELRNWQAETIGVSAREALDEWMDRSEIGNRS